MNCKDADVLMHALLDGELDAGHAREVEAHIEACPDCAARLQEAREFRAAFTPGAMRFTAPASLRARIGVFWEVNAVCGAAQLWAGGGGARARSGASTSANMASLLHPVAPS